MRPTRLPHPPHRKRFFASGCLLGMLPPPPAHRPSQEKSKNEKVLGSLCAHQTHINAHQFWRDPCPILEIEATTHPAHPQSGIEAISARMSPSWAKYMLEDLSATHAGLKVCGFRVQNKTTTRLRRRSHINRTSCQRTSVHINRTSR